MLLWLTSDSVPRLYNSDRCDSPFGIGLFWALVGFFGGFEGLGPLLYYNAFLVLVMTFFLRREQTVIIDMLSLIRKKTLPIVRSNQKNCITRLASPIWI